LSRVWIVVDLAFGDAGKGTITDFLVRDTGAKLVVRFNGGAQAGHNVVTTDGRAHTFSQFGAGTFVPGTRTFLAETVVVHPSALVVEARHIERTSFVNQPLELITIAERARIITPFHQATNRVRELARAHARHGTCGVGVGETVRDSLEFPDEAIVAGDLRDAPAIMRKLERARERLLASLTDEALVLGANHPELAVFFDRELPARWMDFVRPMVPRVVSSDWFRTWLRNDEADVVFEGAQGVLLDETYGFHPHTTWSDCTFRGAVSLLQTHGSVHDVRRIGVVRTYLTRHGQGPFPSENEELRALLPEVHNSSAGWQGEFRVGYPDLVLARYAARVCGGVDAVAVTHMDRADVVNCVAVAYEAPCDEPMFSHDERGRVVDLRDGDLLHQERLGQTLRRVRPVWENMGTCMESRIEQLEAALGAHVAITSAGATAAEKMWRMSTLR
jgi:adenylosuccinate synthase